MGLWEDTLHPCSIAGVAFPLGSRKVHGGRALARRRYPHRDGQDQEDTGREPYSFILTVPLFADVDPAHYPETYERLRSVLDLEQELDYVDAELGPLRAKVVEWDWDQDAERRDGGVLTLNIEEIGSEPVVFTVLSSGAVARQLAILMGAAADDALIDALLDEDTIKAGWESSGFALTSSELDYTEGALFESLVEDFFSDVDEMASEFDSLTARFETLSARVESVLETPEAGLATGWTLTQSLIRMRDVCAQALEQVRLDQPQLVEYRVPQEMSAWQVSVALYGTEDRADEIIRANPRTSPLFYRAGDVLIVASE